MKHNPELDGDTCHFCGKGNAFYGRREDDTRGPYYPACFACARKPYPQPKQFRKEETNAEENTGSNYSIA